jgi:GT2 family glycosyltransferase
MAEFGCKVSVVIISFNGIEFIDGCVASVLKSIEGVSGEVIIVDNGSVDGTVELIKKKYPSVRWIQNEKNLGFARAVNQGLGRAAGEFILLLNQDTRIRGRAIPLMMARLKKDKQVGLIGPKFVGFDGRLQQSCRAFPRYRDLFYEMTGLSYLFPRSKIFSQWKMGWFDHQSERAVDQPMGAAIMIKREALQRIGLMDESFGMFFNDVDFCRRIISAGFTNLYYPEAVVEHFVGGSTRRVKPKMIIESHRSMYRYFRKYNRGIWSLPGLYFWGMMLYLSAIVRAGFYRLLHR